MLSCQYTLLPRRLLPSITPGLVPVLLPSLRSMPVPHNGSSVGSGACFSLSGINRRKGKGRKPHRVQMSTSHDMFLNWWAVTPNSAVSAAPNTSPVPLAALDKLISAAYSVASTPCNNGFHHGHACTMLQNLGLWATAQLRQ